MHYYLFTFSIYDDIAKYAVFTKDRDMMLKFLHQHNFDPMLADVALVTDENYESFPPVYFADTSELHEYTFGSNQTRKLTTIITTEELIKLAVSSVGDDISYISLFGDPITRIDIPIMKMINTLISDLPFTQIKDYSYIDADAQAEFDTHMFDEPTMEEFYKFRELNESSREQGDDSRIYEDLNNEFEVSKETNTSLPITLEAYVHHFVKLFIKS